MNELGASTGAKRIKVLLLQDDEDDGKIMSIYFKRKGIEVYIAYNVMQALKLVSITIPDYLLISIRFLDGWPHAFKQMKAAALQMQIRFEEQAGYASFFKVMK